MPNIRLEFFLDDLSLAWVDRVRDRMSREEYFRRMMQYGLCNAFEELARLSRDYAAQDMALTTGSMQEGRKLLAVTEAQETERTTSHAIRAPHPQPHDEPDDEAQRHQAFPVLRTAQGQT